MYFFEFHRSKLSILLFAGFSITVSALLTGEALAARKIELLIGGAVYQVEIAASSQQRRKGLMHRPYLSPSQGMLLLYPEAGDHRIWMKNMLIPLRVYWIDKDFTVIDMQRVEPCSTTPCAIYSVDRDSRYILELGDYEHPLVPGDRIESLRDL